MTYIGMARFHACSADQVRAQAVCSDVSFVADRILFATNNKQQTEIIINKQRTKWDPLRNKQHARIERTGANGPHA